MGYDAIDRAAWICLRNSGVVACVNNLGAVQHVVTTRSQRASTCNGFHSPVWAKSTVMGVMLWDRSPDFNSFCCSQFHVTDYYQFWISLIRVTSRSAMDDVNFFFNNTCDWIPYSFNCQVLCSSAYFSFLGFKFGAMCCQNITLSHARTRTCKSHTECDQVVIRSPWVRLLNLIFSQSAAHRSSETRGIFSRSRRIYLNSTAL
jgi:hypothetical protein